VFALKSGWVGTPNGELFSGAVTVRNGRITAVSFVTDPDQLQQLDLTILDEAGRSRPAGRLRPTFATGCPLGSINARCP
jgi:hypothetical protein